MISTTKCTCQCCTSLKIALWRNFSSQRAENQMTIKDYNMNFWSIVQLWTCRKLHHIFFAFSHVCKFTMKSKAHLVPLMLLFTCIMKEVGEVDNMIQCFHEEIGQKWNYRPSRPIKQQLNLLRPTAKSAMMCYSIMILGVVVCPLVLLLQSFDGQWECTIIVILQRKVAFDLVVANWSTLQFCASGCFPFSKVVLQRASSQSLLL